MANQVSNILNYAVSVFEAMPLVNTIVLKDDDVIDVEKENVYPLVTLRLLSSPSPQIDLREYRLSIQIFNQRDDRKVATPSKLMSDTNYIDNIGVCDSIGNNFIMVVLKTHNDFDIFVVDDSISEFDFKAKDERNNLDGVSFELTLSTHQNDI